MSIPTEQVPATYRRKLGDILVTALSDGSVMLPPQAWIGVSAEEQDALFRAAGMRPPFAAPINAFLLQWPGHTVLVDTGGGALMGSAGGRLPGNLQAAGVSPGEVDAILMTHLHTDHFGGLLDSAGAPAFPRATLHVAETELAYWQDDAAKAAAPEGRRGGFDAARRHTAAYGQRLQRFAPGEVLPGITAEPLPGHTPGHTGFLVRSGGERLLIWGDAMNMPAIHAARPDVSLVFDTDPAQAVTTRRSLLERAVAEDLLVAGMHVPFPTFSRVSRAGDGFAVQLEPWTTLPS